ncbi:uncharacterized protein B0H18DRAFT_1013828 [Fomitopsis serialis]|uniref:uncharacterized protein n=1 Tax=Fomitopsis serialis TaxID=139415 RepID=UPI002008A239|nr:uncharacterized protein B0H18DRAFT_1013828 [Neoantrodia serialis]KAH9923869.1 hypothetical protein B0H18DRAFT_1013828 [Neoantrodia serialis]
MLSVILVTICIESLLYGIFFVLSVISLYILARRQEDMVNAALNVRGKRRAAYMTPMSVAAVFLFITNTAHWIVAVYRLFAGFMLHEDGTQAIAYYTNPSQPTEVTQNTLLMFSLIIGDAMIIYRLWLVWAYYIPVTVFPISTLIGLVVCAVGSIYRAAMSKPGENIFATATGRWITANCVFTLCTNVYSTATIAWRIWDANRRVRKFGGSSLMGVVGILIESAALYTVWTILFFITYRVQSNLQYFASETYCVIAGITFMLIHVRVGLGWEQRAQSSHDGSVDLVATRDSRQNSYGPPSRVAVNITRIVQRDNEYESGASIKFAPNSDVDLPLAGHS